MTVIADEHGNLFNAEMVLNYEHDVKEVKLLCRALLKQRNEMYEALESTNKELEWAINEINRLYAANHNYHSLDEPERLDMETCHDNAVLLAKARGEQQ